MTIIEYGQNDPFHFDYFYDILSVLLNFGFDDVIDMLNYYVIKSLTLLFPPT